MWTPDYKSSAYFQTNIPRLPLSAHQIDDNIWVLHSPFNGVFVPGIPLL